MSHTKLNERLDSINQKLDEIALQKRLEIEAEHLKRITCCKIVRLFCTYGGSSFGINTRVLTDVGGEDKTPLWDIVKRVCVGVNTKFVSAEREAEGNVTEEEEHSKAPIQLFEWTKESNSTGFVVAINETCKTIQILVKLANQRDVYRLSPRLSRFLGKFTDTRYNVIKDIYKYVNTHKLNDYATSNVKCDEKLEDVFEVQSFNFAGIQSLLEPHLQPIFYCVIDVDTEMVKKGFSASVEGTKENINTSDSIWDIEVETDDLAQMPILFPKYVQQLEKKIDEIRILKRKAKERIDLLTEFNYDPAQFINKKMALGSECIGTKTVFYDDLNVQSALFELIKKKE